MNEFIAAVQGSVRLTGGSDPSIGNVEVLYNGVWGAVCSTGWNADAGRVVCAQLGYNPYSQYFSINPGGRYIESVYVHTNACSVHQSKLY